MSSVTVTPSEGSSPPKMQRSVEDQAKTLVNEHIDKYHEAIGQAIEAAATTATLAWQANYAEQQAAHKKIMRENAYVLGVSATKIESGSSDEKVEKSAKDAIKSISEERERFEAWYARSVDVYRQKVRNCRDLFDSMTYAAQRKEESMPLVSKGLVEAVANLTSKLPRATWDDDTGVVTVVDPAKAEAKKKLN